MGDKWKKAPVFYTVAQLKFNKIALMEKFVPEIQERFRVLNFPDFQRETTIQVAVNDDEKELQTNQALRWSFSNGARTEGYIVLPDAVAYHATSYETFADFSQRVLQGLQVVHQVVKLAYLQRIGLRFLDAIAPTEGHSVENYLTPGLLGNSASLRGKFKHSFAETQVESESGCLISKVLIVEGGLPIPQELHPLQLELPSRFRGLQGRTATLDNDCFSTERMALGPDFDEQKILGKLRDLKVGVNQAFQASITEFALKEWR